MTQPATPTGRRFNPEAPCDCADCTETRTYAHAIRPRQLVAHLIQTHQTEHVKYNLLNLGCRYCRQDVQNMMDAHNRTDDITATVLQFAYRDAKPAADMAATLYNADVAADGSSVDDWGYSECQRKAFVKGAEWEATRHG